MTGGTSGADSRPGTGPEESADNESWMSFGGYLRSQRQLAQLSLRQLAELTKVSNPYLSQIERGLHQPSVSVIKSLAQALNLSVGEMLAHAADIVTGEESTSTTESSIRTDPDLSDSQKSALLAVYRSMVTESDRDRRGSGSGATSPSAPPAPPTT
jgi:transcriptional regulator with XRE-family HTH domain